MTRQKNKDGKQDSTVAVRVSPEIKSFLKQRGNASGYIKRLILMDAFENHVHDLPMEIYQDVIGALQLRYANPQHKLHMVNRWPNIPADTESPVARKRKSAA